MEAYTYFAQVYDAFMDNIPYTAWTEYIVNLLKEYNITSGLMLELGCGTGELTNRLSKKGFDLIGVDNSIDMLNIAREKSFAENQDVLYLLQDMREFELYGTVGSVISVCDSLNYITEPEELVTVFQLVNNYLDPNGIFIFDFKTDYFYEYCLGDKTITDDREDMTIIWDNHYEKETRLNEYDLTIFLQEENTLYRKLEETHFQRGYTLSEITSCIQNSGLEFLQAYDAFTKNPPTDKSQRIYVIAKECGK